MAVTAEDIKTRIVAENADDQAVKQFSQSLGSTAKKARILSAGLKALRGSVVAAFAIDGIKAFNDYVGESIKLANAQENAERKVADVLRAKGEAAGFTANEVLAMASSLQQSTTFGDEEILDAQSVLLAFKNVTGSVFKEASMAVLDMTTVMGTDAKSAAIKLGKALNDPVKGALAMSEAGVQFTDAQKDMMKAMVESNNIAGAQQIILDELAGQIGGAAAGAANTFDGQIQQLSNSYGGMREEIGFVVTESGAMTAIIGIANEAVANLTQWIKNNREQMQEWIAKGIMGAVDGLRILSAAFGVLEGLFHISSGVLKMLSGSLVVLGGVALQTSSYLIEGFSKALEPVRILAIGVDAVGSALAMLTGKEWGSIEHKISRLQGNISSDAETAKHLGESAIAMGKDMIKGGLDSIKSVGDVKDRYVAFDKALQGVKKTIADSTKQDEKTEKQQKALGGTVGNVTGKIKGLNDSTNKSVQAQEKWKESVEKTENVFDNANTAIESAEKFMQKYGTAIEKSGVSTDKMTGTIADITAEFRKAEPNVERIKSLTVGLTEEQDKNKKKTDEWVSSYRKATKDIVGAVGIIGTEFGKMTGSSIQGMGHLQDAIEAFRGNGEDGSSDPLRGALSAAQFIGQNIGGRVGGVISSTASMASAGSVLAPAIFGAGTAGIGALVLGAVGLVSSIFGGGDYEERRARRDEARQQAFNAIQGMALEGGPLSAELMRRSGWNWRNLAGMRSTPDLLEEYGLSWSRRFMADYGVEGARDRQETVKAIDNLLLSIKSFTDSGFSQSLDKLNIKYEYLAQKSHTPAFAEQAKLTDLIQLVTGINADSVVSSISSTLSSAAANGEDAGKIFMESFTREILDGIANTAISQMVTNTIMPILEGPLSQIAQSMTAGEGFDASALAEAVSLAKSAAASVAPAVQELYAAFDASGMWAEAMGDNLNAVNDDLDTVVDKWTALIEEVTGVSASSVTSNIMSAISSMSDQGGDVGDAFVSNFMSSVMSGLQSYAVDQLVSTVIEPMMAPVMDRIANSISISDGIDEEGLSNALTQAEELAQNVAPFVEDLYGVFEEADFYSKPNQTPTADAREQEKQIEEAVRAATLEMSKELEDAQKKIAEIQEQSTRTSASVLQDAAEDAADSLLSAAEALRDYRTDLLANNLGKALGYEQLLRSQKGLVSELAAEALVGTRDSRVTAMQDIPGALRNYLGTFESMATDPLVYAREVARASALIQGIEVEAGLTEQQATTEEVKQLREEVRQMTVTLAQHTAQTAQILKRWEMSGFETTPAS